MESKLVLSLSGKGCVEKGNVSDVVTVDIGSYSGGDANADMKGGASSGVKTDAALAAKGWGGSLRF